MVLREQGTSWGGCLHPRQVKGNIYSAVFYVTISSSLGFPGQCPFLNDHMVRLMTKTVSYLVILKCEVHPWVAMRSL